MADLAIGGSQLVNQLFDTKEKESGTFGSMNLKNKFLAYGSDQHKAILHLSKGCNFVWHGESELIKTAAISLGILQQLDCTKENLTIIILVYYLIDFIFWCQCHSKDPLQPESADDVKDLTKYPEAITVKGPDELTFKGIKKHQVISVVGDGQSKIDALKELLRRSRKVETVVIVNYPQTVRTLIAELRDLSDDGWKVFLPNKKLNKKNRNKTKQELSQSDHPLVHIILCEQARRFDFQLVRLVVNYDMALGSTYHYLDRMGRCREVDAIYFVTGRDWFMLVEIQNEYKVNFEVTSLYGPAGFCLREEQRVAKNLNFPHTAQDIRHFAFDCTGRGWKVTGFLEHVMEEIIQTKSVFFVNALQQVYFLYEIVLGGTYGEVVDSGKFQVFTDYSKFRLCEGCCMLITHDKGVLDIEPPKNVPWVINYDLPSTMVLYNHRIAWCERGGVVVHLVTSHDWLKVFYIPLRYMCFLPWLPRNVPDLVEPATKKLKLDIEPTVVDLVRKAVPLPLTPDIDPRKDELKTL